MSRGFATHQAVGAAEHARGGKLEQGAHEVPRYAGGSGILQLLQSEGQVSRSSDRGGASGRFAADEEGTQAKTKLSIASAVKQEEKDVTARELPGQCTSACLRQEGSSTGTTARELVLCVARLALLSTKLNSPYPQSIPRLPKPDDTFRTPFDFFSACRLGRLSTLGLTTSKNAETSSRLRATRSSQRAPAKGSCPFSIIARQEDGRWKYDREGSFWVHNHGWIGDDGDE